MRIHRTGVFFAIVSVVLCVSFIVYVAFSLLQPVEAKVAPNAMAAAKLVCDYVYGQTGETCTSYEVGRVEEAYVVIVVNGDSHRTARVVIYKGQIVEAKFAPGGVGP